MCVSCLRLEQRVRSRAAYNGSSLAARASALLADARRRAKAKGLPCTISRQWVLERLRSGYCDATGVRFEFDTSTRRKGQAYTSTAPSLDRIDSSVGYTPSNTQVVCAKHNVSKSYSTTREHINYCLTFLRHQGVITNESVVEAHHRNRECSFKRRS